MAWSLFCKSIEMAFHRCTSIPKGGLPTSCAKQAAATTDERSYLAKALARSSLPAQPKFRPLWPNDLPHWLLQRMVSPVMYKGVAGKEIPPGLFCSLLKADEKNQWGHSPAENGFCATPPGRDFQVGIPENTTFPVQLIRHIWNFLMYVGFYIYLRYRTNQRLSDTYIFDNPEKREW